MNQYDALFRTAVDLLRDGAPSEYLRGVADLLYSGTRNPHAGGAGLEGVLADLAEAAGIPNPFARIRPASRSRTTIRITEKST